MKNKLIIVGCAVGALLGYVYYSVIGCSTGGCAITSDPVNSTIYGAVMGGMMLNLFRNPYQKKEK